MAVQSLCLNCCGKIRITWPFWKRLLARCFQYPHTLLASPQAKWNVTHLRNAVKHYSTMVSVVKLKAAPYGLSKCFPLPVENSQTGSLAEGSKQVPRVIAVFVCRKNCFTRFACATKLT
jgi:hypothetical protein